MSMEQMLLTIQLTFMWHTLFKGVRTRGKLICKGLRVTKRNKMWQ